MTNEFEIQYKKLNSKQKDAVSTIEGPVMVIAGPGTGKTTILTLRIANILKETDTQPENILALTFTESAVFSMREKLNKLIGSIAYRVNIFTFHGFCNHLIEQYPEYYEKIISSKAATESDQLNIIQKIIEEGNFSLIKPLGDITFYVTKIRSSISHLKKEGFTPEEYSKIINKKIKEIKNNEDSFNKKTGKLKVENNTKIKKLERSLELSEVYRQYQDNMKKNGLYDFDDMILETLEAFEKEQDFLLEQQEKYQYLLADEHQDTNHAQNKILELLADFHDSPNIFIVGDEKQAIFRFQGASLENFLYFKQRFKDTKIIQLEDNYRSTQDILDNAFELISNNSTDETLRIKLKGYKKDKEKILINEYKNYDQENYGIADEIKDLIKNGTNPEDIAVIYRKNSDITDISKALGENEIPFSVKSKQNILESDDYLRIKIILNAISDPINIENLIPFINLDFLELDLIDKYKVVNQIKKGEDFYKLIETDSSDFVDQDKIREKTNILKDISNQAKNRDALYIFDRILNDLGLLNDIISSNESIERISIINKIYEELKKNSLKKQNYLVEDFIKHLNTIEKYSIDLETYIGGIDEGVSLMTAHGSKGLEFDYVFIIYASQKNWGRKSAPNYFELPYINSELKNNQTTEDERRLFYVAITRARKKVFISYSKFDSDSKENTPTQFISEMNKELVELNEKKDVSFEKIITKKLQKSRKDNKINNKKYLNQLFLNRPMSVTALNNYIECPWRYFYSNLIRIPMPITESLALGNAVHGCMKWYVDNIKNDPNFKDFKSTFIKNIENQSIDEIKKKNIISDSEKFIEDYFEQIVKNIDPNLNYLTEYSIKDVFVEIDKDLKIRLKGNLDRIDILNSNLVSVTDYKTTKPKSINEIMGKTQNSDGNYYRQLVFYKLLVDNHKGWRLKEAELSFIKPDDRNNFISRKFEIEEGEVDKLKNKIKEVSKEILNLEFWNKSCDDPDCQYCKMRDVFN